MLKSVDQCGYGWRRYDRARGSAAFDYVYDEIKRWQLAILRFAITLADTDRDTILAIASEMDRLGGDISRPTFTYFTRTSTELCHAVVNATLLASRATLARYISQVDDARLKGALAVAFELEDGAAGHGLTDGNKVANENELWRGPIR
jgi:hypothetical protein